MLTIYSRITPLLWAEPVRGTRLARAAAELLPKMRKANIAVQPTDQLRVNRNVYILGRLFSGRWFISSTHSL